MADSDSSPTKLTSNSALSRQRIDGLPAGKQQNAKNKPVSQTETPSCSQESTSIKSDIPAPMAHIDMMIIDEQEVNQDSQIQESRSEGDEGDNRGTDSSGQISKINQTDTPLVLDPNKTTNDNRQERITPGSEVEKTPPSPPKVKEPWQDAFLELRALTARMDKVDSMDEKMDKIEESTSGLSRQVTTMLKKTSQLESKTEKNANEIKELKKELSSKNEKSTKEIKDLKKEVSSLRRMVEKQNETITGLSKLKEDYAKQKEAISDLTKMKDDIAKNNKKTMGDIKDDYAKKTKRTIVEMNGLIDQQKEQVDNFNASTKRLKTEILQEVDGKVNTLSQEQDHKALKGQAFEKRHNLVITGLGEDPDKSTFAVAKDYLNSTLGVKDLNIQTALRIGNISNPENTYGRPILIKFRNISHRNKVWKKRLETPNEEGSNTVRIQADLPKKLREGLRLMYRVVKAASTIQKYRSAEVRDYALQLNGRVYAPSQLESLPFPLRPSTLAFRSSEQATVFFSKYSFLSNHHPSKFKIKDILFHTVEHFLAYKRAQLSGQQALVQRALRADNPAEAKSILNLLKEDHIEEYAESRAQWAIEAIRAKFTQNPKLAEALCKTKDLQLGEASKDIIWGIGMDLENPEVLSVEKWSPNGNLLGRSLMDIREELLAAREQRQK